MSKCICLHLDIALKRFYYLSSIIFGINTSWSWTLFYNHKKRISCAGSRKQFASCPYIYFLCMLYTNIKKVVVQVRWIATSSKKKKKKKRKEKKVYKKVFLNSCQNNPPNELCQNCNFDKYLYLLKYKGNHFFKPLIMSGGKFPWETVFAYFFWSTKNYFGNILATIPLPHSLTLTPYKI